MVGVQDQEGVVGGRMTTGGGCRECSGAGAMMVGMQPHSSTQEEMHGKEEIQYVAKMILGRGCVAKTVMVAKMGFVVRKELAGSWQWEGYDGWRGKGSGWSGAGWIMMVKGEGVYWIELGQGECDGEHISWRLSGGEQMGSWDGIGGCGCIGMSCMMWGGGRMSGFICLTDNWFIYVRAVIWDIAQWVGGWLAEIKGHHQGWKGRRQLGSLRCLDVRQCKYGKWIL
jgi:hypothetical protein